MRQQRTMRRVAGLGWLVEMPGVPGLTLVRDDGAALHHGPLVGTAEAAAVVGVRPQNFVRDWASRPDFPAPAGNLSSGRVWRESDVRAYALTRRRPAPDRARLLEIARRVAWWDDPERTFARPEIFVARVLDHGLAADIVDVEAKYGRAVMRRAVRSAPDSLLDDKARNHWELVLGMPHEPAPPVREVRL